MINYIEEEVELVIRARTQPNYEKENKRVQLIKIIGDIFN